MYKITFIIGILLVLLTQGCTQPQMKFDSYQKQKMKAVIWDGVPYHTYAYVQEASKNQANPMALDKVLLGLNTSKVKHLTKYLNHRKDTFNNFKISVPIKAEVYHGLDMSVFTLLSHKVDDIMVTYVDTTLAHVYVRLEKEKSKEALSAEAIKKEVIKKFGSYSDALKKIYMDNFMQEEALADIKNVLNKKFGQAFYYGSAKANNDSNDVWTWGMHEKFYYKVVVDQEDKYAYLSIKSEKFMQMLGEEIIDVKKWQRKQDDIAESMLTVHKRMYK